MQPNHDTPAGCLYRAQMFLGILTDTRHHTELETDASSFRQIDSQLNRLDGRTP